MKKRKSRRELKDTIIALREELKFTRAERDGMKNNLDNLEKRLRIAGIRRGPIENVPSIETEVKIETWGMYAYVSDDLRAIDVAKKKLVENIAEALIDKNIVQFIVKVGPDKDYPMQPSTVGAKLYCIPWEKAALKEGMTICSSDS